MIEKVNPKHPDKVADRIAGAIVDLAYKVEENPKVAVEVLIGHGKCQIIIESNIKFVESNLYDSELTKQIYEIVYRITKTKDIGIEILSASQDLHLADNQVGDIKCGDNGIFKGVPLTDEEITLSKIARTLYDVYNCDGKYILNGDKLIVCQSNATSKTLKEMCDGFGFKNAVINPLGDWTGGINVDSGATNRKLGSDMAQSVTGGGLHGKDLSKADVSVNIYAFLKAQETGKPVELCCAIGDDTIDGRPYGEIVEIARNYINQLGGFEKFAEWGLY